MAIEMRWPKCTALHPNAYEGEESAEGWMCAEHKTKDE
jgi:hypothetical protein